MIRAEFYRLFKNKSFILIILSFFIVSFAQCLYVSTQEDVRNLSNDISILNTTDFSTSVDSYTQAKLYGISEPGAFRADLKQRYTTTYTDLLKNTEDKMQSVLFSSKASQKELQKQKEVCQTLLTKPFVYMNDILFTQYSSLNKYWNFIYVLIGLYCIYILIQQDIDSSLFPLFSSCWTSFQSLFLSKIIMILLCLTSLYLCKTSIDLMFFHINGIDLSAPIQQLYTYDFSSFTLPIGTYYVVFSSIGWISALVVLAGYTYFYAFTKSSSLAFFISTIFMLIELLLQRFVSIASVLRIFKEWNLYTLMSMEQLSDSTSYFLGNVIPHIYLIAIVCGALVIVLFGLSIYFFQYAKLKKAVVDKRICLGSSFFSAYQWKEILLQRKAIFIVLAVFAYCFYDASHYKVVKSNQEASYETFVQQYYGPIDDALLQKIQSDKQNILKASQRSDELVNKMIQNEGILTDEEAQELSSLESTRIHKDDIERVEAEVDALHEIDVEYFVDNTSLEYLVEKKNPIGSLLHFLLVAIPLICIIFSTMSKYYQEDAYRYIDCTKTGKVKYLVHQWLHFFIIGILLSCIVYGLFYYKITKYYPYTFTNQTMNQALGITSTIHMYTWICLSICNYILVISLLISLAMTLSQKLGVIYGIGITTSFLLLSCAIPNGLFMVLRYDFLNHVFQYCITITCIALGIACLCILNIVENEK